MLSFPYLATQNLDIPTSIPLHIIDKPLLNKYYLIKNSNGIWQLSYNEEKPIYIDFSDKYYRCRGGKEYLPKAFKKLPNHTILDATAGWGRDAWLLAYRGFKVTLCEQHPALYLMLKQAVERAKNELLTTKAASNLLTIYGNSEEHIKNNGEKYDAIYLDPMFPPRTKQAKVKKDMQILHTLISDFPNNGDQLLDIAINSGCKKIIVKRPKGADFLNNMPPHHSLQAPNTRYDIYINN
ncbi:class I SAM-dependent methyltransferase [Suttonella ornithocola]|uniref:Ribosomal RNA small subunit methyltransferase J n=1 Tax=Suttonella ornithocola TaxID=279832 RepID=A0A380MTT7_9GAMM|nr:class I SAM-dependent methyltransferase [Suttonella ornithocola]SUO96039.1 Ribosomal RNA small subunit methyltransferase J [Suttonella ornithocola]